MLHRDLKIKTINNVLKKFATIHEKITLTIGRTNNQLLNLNNNNIDHARVIMVFKKWFN